MRFMIILCLAQLISTVVLRDDGKQAPTPADSLNAMQGNWVVTSNRGFAPEPYCVPDETKIGLEGTAISFHGNQVHAHGQMVATLTNDFPPLPQTAKESSLPTSATLLLLTLPSGKGIWCSYNIEKDMLRLACPHTATCSRTGQIIYLKRSVAQK